MFFDRAALASVCHVLARLPQIRYDKLLPESMRSADYGRRMKRKAAVAVALANVKGHASVLLTLRSKAVGSHAGQVSFPGGHMEEGESAEQACLRELHEEVGLVASALGRYHDTRAITGTMVTPVLCFVDKPLSDDAVVASKHMSVEVEQVFHVRLEDLVKKESRTMDAFSGRWTMPRFQCVSDGRAESHPPVWGLTAFILDGILRDVLVPALDLGEYPPSQARDQSA